MICFDLTPKHNRQIQPKRLVHYVGVSWLNLASYSTQCGTRNMILDIVFLILLIVSLVINEIPLKFKNYIPNCILWHLVEFLCSCLSLGLFSYKLPVPLLCILVSYLV